MNSFILKLSKTQKVISIEKLNTFDTNIFKILNEINVQPSIFTLSKKKQN